MQDEIRLIDIYKARQRLHGHIPHCAGALAEPCPGTPAAACIKLDCRQITGSFKLRGPPMRSCSSTTRPPSGRDRGIDRQLRPRAGHAAHQLGVRAVICMSRLVPPTRWRRSARWAPRLRIIGSSQDEAELGGRPAGRRGGPGPSAAFRSPPT